MKVTYTGSVTNTGVWTKDNLPTYPFLLITEEGTPLLIIVNYISRSVVTSSEDRSDEMSYVGYSPKEETVTKFTIEELLVEMNKPLAGLRKANIRGEVCVPIEADDGSAHRTIREPSVDEKPFFLNVEGKGLTLFNTNKTDSLTYIGYSLNRSALWSINKRGLLQWEDVRKYQSLENLTIEVSNDVILPASK